MLKRDHIQELTSRIDELITEATGTRLPFVTLLASFNTGDGNFAILTNRKSNAEVAEFCEQALEALDQTPASQWLSAKRQ